MSELPRQAVMSCGICGAINGWVGYDGSTKQYRCANHVGSTKRPEYTYTEADIDHTIEIRDVFDGASIAVLKDGRRLNLWADPTRPTEPIREGYRWRFEQVRDYIERISNAE